MRKPKIPAGLSACACLLLLAAAAAQAKSWRGIVPLRTTRAQVERRFGKPSSGPYYDFKTEKVTVVYSPGRGCPPGQGWDVPRDTVVQIVVVPQTRLRLSDLRLDMRGFKKSQAPGDAHAYYTDRKAGLTYEVYEGQNDDYGLVLQIQYDPSARDEHLRCPQH